MDDWPYDVLENYLSHDFNAGCDPHRAREERYKILTFAAIGKGYCLFEPGSHSNTLLVNTTGGLLTLCRIQIILYLGNGYRGRSLNFVDGGSIWTKL